MDENALAKVRNQKLGFVFQDFLLLDGLTVRENIMLPRIIAGRADRSMEQSAEQLWISLGSSIFRINIRLKFRAAKRQRTAVARALINNPLLILADEPTGNLDSKSSRAVIDSFLRARESLNATIFMVTHDSFAASFCDRVVILRDGVVYRTLQNHGNREQFQDELLDVIREMGKE